MLYIKIYAIDLIINDNDDLVQWPSLFWLLKLLSQSRFYTAHSMSVLLEMC